MPWQSTTKYGVVIKDYTARSPHCLPLTFGDTVRILEENGDWYRGRALKRHSKWGIFPKNHIHLKPCQVDNRGEIESTEDPVAREVADVLREWGTIMKEIYQNRGHKQFLQLRDVAHELIEWRVQILSGTLPDDHLKELKSKVTTKIDWGNRAMRLDLIPRNERGEVIDADTTSVIELFQIHRKSVETGSRTTNTGSIKRTLSPNTLKREPPKMHHLLFKHSAFAVNIGEETDLYYSLFDAGMNQFVSESYYVRLTNIGFPFDVENLDNLSCVFTELSTRDVSTNGEIQARDLYLVCRIYRNGPMEYGKDIKKAKFRRPVGVAITSLRKLIEASDDDKEDEEAMPVYKGDEDNFYQLHEHVIRGNQSKFSVLDRAKGVTVKLRMLTGDLMRVRKENPLLFKKGTGIARKRGFPEVIMPGDVRNDFYFTLGAASFDSGRKLRPKNIEATLMVCLKDGKQLKDCILVGAGDKPRSEYTSTIYYHTNSPKWFETIKLDIPIDKFENAHIKIYFKHCSSTESKDKSPPFCFSFIPLMKGGVNSTTIDDDEHEIRVYKYDERYDSTNGPPAYLTNPTGMQSSQNEKLLIRTLICSTKLTQNLILLNLLKWKQQQTDIKETLKHLTYVKGEDIVKFLTDIFDAVFAILDHHPDHADLVFEALVFIFGLLGDKKFHNFATVLDAYIQKHFSGAKAHKTLVGCLKSQIQSARDPQKGQSVRSTLKGLEYIFKFIVRSRELYKRAKPTAKNEEFKAELMDLFASFNGMMRLTEPTMVLGTQDTALQYFASIFSDLDKIFTIDEMAQVACNFVASIQFQMQKSNKYQMAFLKSLVEGPVFQNPQGRKQLLPAILTILETRLNGSKQELLVSLEILGDILTTLQKDEHDTYDDVLLVVTRLLLPVVGTAQKIARNHVAAGELLACLLGLLHLMNDASIKSKTHNRADRDPYKAYLAALGSKKDLAHFLMSIFQVFKGLVTRNALPADWIVMRMLQNDIILNTVQFLSEAVRSAFLSGTDFHFELWDSFFQLSVAYLTQSNLQLEEFTEVKRDKILAKHGDKRELMAYQIVSMWQELGAHQIRFIPSLVGPLLQMALVPETQLRKLTIPIYADMMECEVAESGSFTRVETEIIDKLDVYVTDGRGDAQFKELMEGILLEKCRKSKHKIIKDKGPEFVESVTQLLTRLLALRDVPAGVEYRDQRAAAIYNLMLFYKDIDRTRMYIRYVYKLSDIHIAAGHFSEAAFTLALHAELLNWSDNVLEPYFDSSESSLPRYEQQTERMRKCAIYHKAIELFDRGHTWENAIPLCKELAVQYESELFNYVKLSSILKQQAQFFDSITEKLRSEPQYFRVSYWGLGFPKEVANKEFVYRGLKQDHITVFCDRIRLQFPQSQLIMNKVPKPEMKTGTDQHIGIAKMEGVVDDEVFQTRFKGKSVSDKLKAFYKCNELNKFMLDRPFRKGEKTPNEFETLWVERCTVTTERPLPGLLNRALIIKSDLVEISPIENAITSMVNKNKELQDIIGAHAKDPSLNVNPLTMCLNGVIDAAVMGGTDKYREAFFGPKYIESNPSHGDFIDRLKTLISQQLEILEAGVIIHGKHCPESLKPMQNKLEGQLQDMKKKDSTTPSRSASTSSIRSQASVTGPKSPRRPSDTAAAQQTAQQNAAKAAQAKSETMQRSQSVKPAGTPKPNPFKKSVSSGSTPVHPQPPPRSNTGTPSQPPRSPSTPQRPAAAPSPSSNPFSVARRPPEPLPNSGPVTPSGPVVPARSSTMSNVPDAGHVPDPTKAQPGARNAATLQPRRTPGPAPPARSPSVRAPVSTPSEAPPPRPAQKMDSRSSSSSSIGGPPPPRPSSATKPKAVIQTAKSNPFQAAAAPRVKKAAPPPAKKPAPTPAQKPKSNPFQVSPDKKVPPAVPRRSSGTGAGLPSPPKEAAPPRPNTAKPNVAVNPFPAGNKPPAEGPPPRPPK